MKANELMEYVADCFVETMRENEFDSFEEMKNCYWWDSKDIHREVAFYVQESESGWWTDEDTDLYYYSDNTTCTTDFIEYRKFINGVYKVLRARGIYKEQEHAVKEHSTNRCSWWEKRGLQWNS